MGPRRIVCLTEEPTETLYALGEQDRIVGISGFTVRPPQARRDKPKVSAFTSAKTEAMIQGNEACLYEMPAAPAYGRKGALVNLNDLIKADKDFKNVWGAQLQTAQSWGPNDPKSLFYIPDNTGERVVQWDAKLFKDWGVEPLSKNPTLDEVAASDVEVQHPDARALGDEGARDRLADAARAAGHDNRRAFKVRIDRHAVPAALPGRAKLLFLA